MGKCIGSFVKFSRLVLDDKMEELKILYPLGMSWVGLVMTLDIV